MTYILYATDNHGDGHVEEIGRYETLEEMRIRVGFFAKDVVITIEESMEE